MRNKLFLVMLCFTWVYAQNQYAQVETLMQTISKEFQQHKSTTFKQHFSFDFIVQTIAKKLDKSSDLLNKKLRFEYGDIAESFYTLFDKNASCDVIDIRQEGKRYAVIVRFISADLRLYSYYKFILEKKDNKLVIIDWLTYVQSQYFSEFLLYTETLKNASFKFVFSGNAFALVDLANMVTRYDIDGIKKAYIESSESMRHEWLFMLLFAKIIPYDKSKVSLNILQDMIHNFPVFRTLFIKLQYYQRVDDFEKVSAIYDEISALFDHKDAFIFYLQAKNARYHKKPKQALKYLKKAIQLSSAKPLMFKLYKELQ